MPSRMSAWIARLEIMISQAVTRPPSVPGKQALADHAAQRFRHAGADLRLLRRREDVKQAFSVVAASLVCMVPMTR